MKHMIMTRLLAYPLDIDPPPKTQLCFSSVTLFTSLVLFARAFCLPCILSHHLCFVVLPSSMLTSWAPGMQESVELARLVFHYRTVWVCARFVSYCVPQLCGNHLGAYCRNYGMFVPCAQTLMWSIIFVLVDAMVLIAAKQYRMVPCLASLINLVQLYE